MWGATYISYPFQKTLLVQPMFKNYVGKHPLQNRTNVQIKGGGGVKGLLNNVQKNITFPPGWLPLLPSFLVNTKTRLEMEIAPSYKLLTLHKLHSLLTQVRSKGLQSPFLANIHFLSPKCRGWGQPLQPDRKKPVF